MGPNPWKQTLREVPSHLCPNKPSEDSSATQGLRTPGDRLVFPLPELEAPLRIWLRPAALPKRNTQAKTFGGRVLFKEYHEGHSRRASGTMAENDVQPSLGLPGVCFCIPVDPKIHGCSSPLYKMAWYLPITYIPLFIYFKSSLDNL